MFKIKFIITLLLLFYLSVDSLLYARQNDQLYLNGELFYINNRFLLHNNIQQYIHDNNFDDYFITHANYYTAEFVIKENHFFLKEIKIYPSHKDCQSFNLSECDENTISDFRKINLNTVLVVSKKSSDLIGIDTTKKQFKIIEIKDNLVIKILDLKNVEEFLKFRCEQFLKYKATEGYKKNYYYSLKTTQNSRERFDYEDEKLPIEEEVNNFIELLFLKENDYSSIF